MGNDIKVPISQRQQNLETQKAAESEQKEQLNYEIEQVSCEIAIVQNRIEKIEQDLKRLEQETDYYQNLILQLSSTLNQIEMEKVNTYLIRENYLEQAKTYLESMQQIQNLAPTDDYLNGFSEDEIVQLEIDVAFLKDQVSSNEENIINKITQLSI